MHEDGFFGMRWPPDDRRTRSNGSRGANLKPGELSAAHRRMFDEPRIATSCLVDTNGRLHATPIKVAVSADISIAVALISSRSVKAQILRRHVAAGAVPRAAFAEHTNTLWVSLEGPVQLIRDEDGRTEAELLYSRRYGQQPSWGDTVLKVSVERVLAGS